MSVVVGLYLDNLSSNCADHMLYTLCDADVGTTAHVNVDGNDLNHQQKYRNSFKENFSTTDTFWFITASHMQLIGPHRYLAETGELGLPESHSSRGREGRVGRS